MKKIIYTFIAALLIFPSVASAQQNLRSGYFLDGYVYKYKMNPAMAPERGFIAAPVIGYLGVGLESNTGLSTFLYPTESGRLTTFLSPRVSDETFLANIADNNKSNLNLDLNLFALGFRTGKSYHTLDVSAKIGGGMNVPGDLYRYMKVGGALGDTQWDLSDIGVRSSSRLELAYGLSRSFGKNLRVGLRAKFLVGVFNLDFAMDKMTLEANAEKWAVQAHGNMMMAGILSLQNTEGSVSNWTIGTGEDIMASLMDPSYGFALDLGATYDFLEYFTASLSVQDLGFMSWKNTTIVETPHTAWSFEGFESIESDQIGDQINSITSDITDALNFEVKEAGTKKTSALAATINAGIEARMPFYQRLAFGLLYTQRIEGVYSWSEGRIAASLAPTRWFSLSTNYAISNFGHSWGGAVNLHVPGIGIFVGMDSFTPLLNVTPQYIPINPINTNLALGINVTFGKYHGRYPKKEKKQDKE